MKKWIFSTLLVLFCSPVLGQVTFGQIALKQTHKKWSSFLLTTNGLTESRAFTYQLDGDIPMALDFSLPNCAVTLTFYLSLDTAVKQDVTRTDVILSFRADSGTRFDLTGTSRITMGDTTGIVTLDTTDRFVDLIAEMRRGSSLRTKILFGHNEKDAIYMTYSLDGFTAASSRALDLCMRPANINNRNQQRKPPIDLL